MIFGSSWSPPAPPPEGGFAEPHFGGERLKEALLDVLPAGYAQTLRTLDDAMRDLRDLYARHALPHIVGYSTLAATAGALPVPWLDLLILPGIQTQMIHHLAHYYGQPLTAGRFLELASTLGLGVLLRQAAREVVKFIPFVGSVMGGMLAGASTFALGKACCYYYSAVHQGHVPRPEELRRYYHEELARAERSWSARQVPGVAGSSARATVHGPAVSSGGSPPPRPPPPPGGGENKRPPPPRGGGRKEGAPP